MSYAPDPGGIFDSDTHRRVLGHVPDQGTPRMSFNALGLRVSADPFHGMETADDLAEVLRDLAADGYVTEADIGWVTTRQGMTALRAPVAAAAPQRAGPVLIGLEPEGG